MPRQERRLWKTSLVKLLMGFYRLESGTNMIDEVNIQEMVFGKL